MEAKKNFPFHVREFTKGVGHGESEEKEVIASFILFIFFSLSSLKLVIFSDGLNIIILEVVVFYTYFATVNF